MDAAAYIPTPPFTPIHTEIPHSDGSLHSTLNLLDALDEFYCSQRDWIEKTRAALDQAFEDSEAMQSEQSKSSLPSPPSSESDLSGTARSDITDNDQRLGSATRPSPDWARRKKGLQLTLDIRNDPQRHRRIRRITSRKDLEQRKRMLNMLDEIVQARMESCRYTALNSRADHDPQDDMEAAFDYTEDDDDDINDSHESHPLNPDPTSPSTIQAPPPNPHPLRVPGTYDFENVDYDYPPPGSPPRPSAIALPNDYGNSNGLIPQIPDGGLAPRPSWLRRTTVSILPARFAQSLGLTHQRPQGAIGGGTVNDGVFANVTAKPTRPVTVQEGDDTFVVPEETRAEAPPSYASAQADAVPPYWETTVHAPFTPGAIGEVIVDNLPTGSLFSFLWNMLVSVSFQFVGFLLTYLLHTTHAAKLGSRAGLGVTLIQYGFALRGQLENPDNTDQDAVWGNWGQVSRPTMAEGTSPYSRRVVNSTGYPSATDPEQASSVMVSATTEWLSFLLMTIGMSLNFAKSWILVYALRSGWFLLLTSLLGFWRVKRWEKSILASQRDSAPATETRSSFSLFSGIENNFALRGSSRFDFFRTGFGLGRRQGGDDDDETIRATVRAEEGAGPPRNDNEHALETDAMIPADPNPLNRSRLIREALEHDRRLHADLRSAGLL
ncbi:hypothetical protein C0995_005525 [Termitomyces sp. Mi166|nr:hypothetical protein C0995_005525 [Termitomyces sp. Mi166\